jgi:hypothetical protein
LKLLERMLVGLRLADDHKLHKALTEWICTCVLFRIWTGCVLCMIY